MNTTRANSPVRKSFQTEPVHKPINCQTLYDTRGTVVIAIASYAPYTAYSQVIYLLSDAHDNHRSKFFLGLAVTADNCSR